MSDVELRPELRQFAEALELRLRKNDHKNGWERMTPDECLHRANQEMYELMQALAQPVCELSDVRHEVEDSADFLFFLWHVADPKFLECATCGGSGGHTEDKWSYGDSRGRGEGHYTVDHKCPCCKGEGVFPSLQEAEEHKGHDGSEHYDGPEDPPELDD